MVKIYGICNAPSGKLGYGIILMYTGWFRFFDPGGKNLLVSIFKAFQAFFYPVHPVYPVKKKRCS
jgi:hypothetical protein